MSKRDKDGPPIFTGPPVNQVPPKPDPKPCTCDRCPTCGGTR